jgi:hypothetical protein
MTQPIRRLEVLPFHGPEEGEKSSLANEVI